MMFYVYAYHDPTTGIPFYVGKGSDDRCSHHADNARYYRTEDKFPRGYNRHLHYKICQIRAAGLEPVIYVWHRDLPEKQALLLEKTFIKLLGRDDLGTGPLLNLTDGGEGVSGRPPWNKGKVPSVEIVAQISATLKSYSQMPEGRARREAHSEWNKQYWNSPAGIAQRQAQGNRSSSNSGRKHTDDAKQLISSSKKAAWATKRAEENVNGRHFDH